MNTPLVVLIVLDGWGVAPPSSGNAISQAATVNMNKFLAGYPHTTLAASGVAVGLPRGEAGNTETGHLNLGGGRIVYQDLMRVDMSIADGSFSKNDAFLGAISHAKENKSNLHIMGLIGAGSVHSNVEHLFALLRLCREQDFDRVYLHLFTDGRDSPPTSAENYLVRVEAVIRKDGIGQIASIMGRYWAMDRDHRWERTEKAYKALTEGVGRFFNSPKEAIEASYAENITDEFISPSIIIRNGKPVAVVSPGDSVIFFNFRIDRPRQLTQAFVFGNFKEEAQKKWDFDPYAVKYHKTHLVKTPKIAPFERGAKINNLYFATMTEYEKPLIPYVHTAFPPVVLTSTLGEVISNQALGQLRISESEKERFVTFYFNGQRETAFQNEERNIVDSPNVPTYDQKPEMSANEIVQVFLEATKDSSINKYSFILINFANPDMVGHTGNIEAAKQACEAVDRCLGEITKRVDSLDGVTLITADHGNAEQMLSPEGKPHTEHTINPVPFIVVGKKFLGRSETLQSGILADVAPTVLKLLGIAQPSDMTGRALI